MMGQCHWLGAEGVEMFCVYLLVRRCPDCSNTPPVWTIKTISVCLCICLSILYCIESTVKLIKAFNQHF